MKIKKCDFIISGVKPEHYPKHEMPEIVLLGRSNVGKSTFINSFVNNKKMAYVSSNPGKTQVLNFFNLNDNFVFVDVPGYGYAKVSKVQREEFGKMIERYLTEREQLAFAILLVDFRIGPTQDDILMYDFLCHYGIEVLVVATKKDKVKKSLLGKQMNLVLSKLEGINKENVMVYTKEDRNTLTPIYNYVKESLDLEDE